MYACFYQVYWRGSGDRKEVTYLDIAEEGTRDERLKAEESRRNLGAEVLIGLAGMLGGTLRIVGKGLLGKSSVDGGQRATKRLESRARGCGHGGFRRF